MFNVSPFASLTEVNRMLSAWGYQATAYEPARGGVENQCLIVDTPPISQLLPRKARECSCHLKKQSHSAPPARSD